MSRSLARHVVRHWPVSMIACAALLAAPAAHAIDSGDIIVVKSRGEVHITVNGAARSVRDGGVLELPATVRTGRNGNIELRQGATSVSVAPETMLEFPALEKRGAPIDRIQQPRGNAFYNIGKREGRKLRVETPYLVAVIKGTQFNVAAHDESTTISLFEGLLEVRAADDGDAVDLKAGEIATRKRGDNSIGIIKMDAGKPPPTGRRAPAASGPSHGVPGATTADESLVVDRVVNSAPVDVNVGADPRNSGAALDTGASVGVPVTGDDVVAPAAEVTASVGLDAGPATIDVAAGNVDVAVDAVVDAGPATAGVDAGPLTTDVSAGTTVDLPSGTVGAGVDAGVIVGASAPQVEVRVGSDVAADAVAGTVNIGLEVGGADLNLGVDLGLDGDNSGPGNGDDGNSGHGNDDDHSDSSNSGGGNNNDTVVDVGALLDTLTRRRKK
ncbi:MAG TPA: FecR family protein [Steroidobacteraceae bacterium]|nr:FecR family protein [Steroidobacteraceae bacterium]